ncbi:MAG: hypothetical protein M3R02_21460, partial [Chloroflexota bacterium]|nr:hypothetical protein [Chloroflexota bacterium]
LDDFLAAGHGVADLLALVTDELRRPPTGDEEPADVPYEATPGGLYWRKSDALPVRLTNFTATITADVLEDDGVEPRRLFEVEAVLRDRVSRFTVPAGQFPSMAWVAEHLGAGAIVEPGQGVKERARVAIQTLSGDVPERQVYAHTGWRRIDDAWAYLHAGGATGSAGAIPSVEVGLGGSLGGYALPAPPNGQEQIEAVRASLALLDLLPLTVAVPLLAATYLAPLREALGGEPPDFVPWLHGPSGTFKSEQAALAQAHYGDFTRPSLPASFAATPNAIERLCSATKDALLVVDDYHPASDPREGQAMAQVASRLLRGAGNGVGRARMRADTTLRPELRPRCVVLATGERLPEGHSAAARMFPVAVGPGEVHPEKLGAAQEQRALYPVAMAAYLQHLAGRLDDLSASLRGRFRGLRRRVELAGAHAREPGQVAHLHLALEEWLGFATEIGAITDNRRVSLLAESWRVLVGHAGEHAQDLAEETPVSIFLALLADGFAGKRAYLEAPSGGPPANGEVWGWEGGAAMDRLGKLQDGLRHPVAAALLGTLDGDWLLLYPEATYQFVQSAARAAGRVFPVESRTLLRRLDEAGLIAKEPGSGRRTPNVWTGQGTRRVIKLRRALLDLPASSGQREFGEDGAVDGYPAPAMGWEHSPNGRDGWGSGKADGAGKCPPASSLPPIPSIPPSSDGEERSAASANEEVFEWAATI